MLYNYKFRPFFKVIVRLYLLSRESGYHDDKLDYFDDEISITLTHSLP